MEKYLFNDNKIVIASHNKGKGGCGCATEGHVDYMNCGCTEGGTENAWPED